jgi:SAM-dependent methyltransferase
MFKLSNIIKLAFILLWVFQCQALHAQQYSHQEALELCFSKNLSMPSPESDGRIQTLNEFGSMAPVFDPATLQFIQYSVGKKVLEIGAAYGKVMTEILSQNPSTEYHINDLDERHLFLAAKNLSIALDNQDPTHKISPTIKYIVGDLVHKDFRISDQYDAVLIARVMHFFNPEKMDIAISRIAKSLKPKGRVYVVAITPYVKRYQSFIPVYEKRLANNEAYPGYVESLKDWLNVKVTTQAQQASINKEPFMFLDDRVLRRAFSKFGFNILECKTVPIDYKSESWALDGRENVILIAEKIAE